MIDLNMFSSGIQHIGIPTNDIKATADFYVGLGFQLVYSICNGGEEVRFLQLGNLVIEAYQNNKASMSDGAIDHIAIDVTQIDSLYSEMTAAGYSFLTQGIESLPFWEMGIKYFIIEGPNKERLEFCERLKAQGSGI